MVGKADLIDAIRKNPLLRAMRIDKLSLAALEETLRLYQEPFEPEKEIPVLSMLTARLDDLKARAVDLANMVTSIDGVDAEVVPIKGEAGGGSLPGIELKSFCIALDIKDKRPQHIVASLREGSPAIIARIVKDKVVLDVRTLMPGDDKRIVAALEAMAAS